VSAVPCRRVRRSVHPSWAFRHTQLAPLGAKPEQRCANRGDRFGGLTPPSPSQTVPSFGPTARRPRRFTFRNGVTFHR